MLIKNKMQENVSCSKPIARVLLIDDIWKIQLLSQAQIKGMRRHKEEINQL